MWSLKCVVCSGAFESLVERAIYCGNACKREGWKQKHPEAVTLTAPKLCCYVAKHCEDCGKAGGSRRPWRYCKPCGRRRVHQASGAARVEAAEALFRAAGRVVSCEECGIQFCPLRMAYGMKLCECCKRDRQKAHKDKRDERIKVGEREPVIRNSVFARCGWRCQLCGIETPKALRGTYEHNAPELDHIVPLSRGGGHTYANTQCLCRSCNGWKSARTMEEAIAALAA